MKTYLILDLAIKDFPGFMEYINKIPTYLEKHEGKYIVEGVEPELIEGDWKPERVVVLEFSSKDNAKAFLSDPEIQPIFAIRHRTTDSKLILVEGSSWRDSVDESTHA
ncbi:MAG: hypothetical protein COA99_19705 [Moraxellaceae bacterium]|nr:MAG: hypothetical protein COA99_19705 [Moraxellaceae bacterium]